MSDIYLAYDAKNGERLDSRCKIHQSVVVECHNNCKKCPFDFQIVQRKLEEFIE